METLMNTTNDLAANEALREITQQIMSISEENLNEDSLDVIGGMIQGALTPRIKQECIKSIIQNFEDTNLTRAQAAGLVDETKKELQQYIEQLQPSPHKKVLLDLTFNFFYEIFDEAFEQYHSYVFDLPIKLGPGAQLPTYAHTTDACADIYASEDITIPAHSLSNLVHTGLRIALPENWVFMLEPRSSIGLKTGLRLSNAMGIIDEDYRGEIGILFDNFSDSDFEIKAGDRIVQGWVQPVYRFRPVSVDILPATERGEGGFGSSGR